MTNNRLIMIFNMLHRLGGVRVHRQKSVFKSGILKFWACVGFTLLLASCADDNHDLVQYIHQVKLRKTRPIEPLPVFTPLPEFKFPSDDKRRNPFKPTNQKKFVDPYAPDQHRMKQPLEAFPLDALKFVGILKQDNDIWALIKLPDGQISRVRVGDYMGQNYGRILLIKNNLLKLEETIKGPSGRWEKHKTTLEYNTGK